MSRDQDAGEGVEAVLVGLPDEILWNRVLVHKILLTDPADFGTLSLDGGSEPTPSTTPKEFMSRYFSPRKALNDRRNGSVSRSMEELPTEIARSMKTAFFDKTADEMDRGDFQSIRRLLEELHSKMRSLLPLRKDLHSNVDDGQLASCSSARDFIRVLIRSGNLLANHLESAVRAPTTRELIESLNAFLLAPRGGEDPSIPYGIESENALAVASAAYIIQKAELCQTDVCNYKLSRAAPLLHRAGHEYERDHFRKTFGDYRSATAEELRAMLPATWEWVQKMRSGSGNGGHFAPQSTFEQKLDFVKGVGFVDGLIFTRSKLALPEILSLDVSGIDRIRSEARCCVIASALALHACNISKVGRSAMNSSVMSSEVDSARQALSSALRKRYYEQNDLECSVVKATGNLTKALAERELIEEDLASLRNHALSVLRGNDPVLKLLDSRVQSFFRFVCKWKPDAASVAPANMRTGRLNNDTGHDAARHGMRSTKEEYLSVAGKEAERLGFGHFGPGLIEAGREARSIISLACTNYGQDILSRFLIIAWEEA